ncbi:MAG: tryptophan 7-halogenase [Verrucomicrobiales bacterium]|nr:tryptophan 7-halogenase [Verrucomicrobiales bacterium]
MSSEEGSNRSFDVLIMGAGFAGLCQARHLMLKVPGLRVGLIDPKGMDQAARDLKVGESLVEISAMFLYRELELHEYLIENHPPKYGLNFHWPKKIGKTDTIHDYHHIWTNGSPDLPSYQINRAKFEADLLQMCVEMGVEFIQGKVKDLTIGAASEPHEVLVKTKSGATKFSGRHLVDAAGRKFLIGRKLDNVVRDKDELVGLETGSAWLRVDDIDRDLFQTRREETNGSASHYYGTNHWFGYGHWVWMIPIEKESRALSIGVVHHKNCIDGSKLNSREKFLRFLKANHRILFNMIESGTVLDFKYLPKVAHGSREMISKDQWYVIGEAANMYDPFYSTGLVLAAHNIELVTEVIRAKKADEPDAEEKREAYDGFILKASRIYNHVYQDHPKHLGDANAMSWRIYMESIFWFGVLVPMFTGKWHHQLDFIKQFHRISDFFFLKNDSVISSFYHELTRAQESGKTLGMLNYTRTDQLAFGYNPLRLWDSFRQNSKYEPRRLNVLLGIRNSIFYLGLLYAKLRVKNSGIFGLFEPKTVKHLFSLAGWTVYAAMGELAHRFEVRNRPGNSQFAMEEADFAANYRYKEELVEWVEEEAGKQGKAGADVLADPPVTTL